MPADGSGPRRSWTTLAALRSQSRTAWDRGALLREMLEPSGAYPRRRTLKRPTAAELLSHYGAARDWAAELFAGAGQYTVETADVGRYTVGANRLPAAAVFATVDDEIAFAGHSREASRFKDLAAALSGVDPALLAWATKRPLQLLALGDDALTAARLALWLRAHPSPGIYLRQLSLPGVHTKFIESHRRTIDELAAMLADRSSEDDVAENAETVAGNSSAAGFAGRHGFLHPPELVRFRLLDPQIPSLGDARDLSVTAAAFATLHLSVRTVIVTENLVNFLALPERAGTLALFGRGYGFTALRDAVWLRDCEVLYWGDLDTHGFRILDQLRAAHPHVRSMLMDEATLLAHRDAWGQEPAPSRAALARLTPGEADLYTALIEDKFGRAVRLEQELIGWDWALKQLPV